MIKIIENIAIGLAVHLVIILCVILMLTPDKDGFGDYLSFADVIDFWIGMLK